MAAWTYEISLLVLKKLEEKFRNFARPFNSSTSFKSRITYLTSITAENYLHLIKIS